MHTPGGFLGFGNNLGTLIGCLLLCGALQAQARQPYRIGVVAPFSGALGYVGEDIRDGLLLARAENRSQSYDYQFIFEDNHFELRDSVAAAQKLINVDHVQLLISLWDAADVIAPLTERSGTLHISIRWNPDVAAKHRYTFTLESTYIQYAASQRELLEALGASRVAIIRANTQGNTLGASELERLLADGPVKVVRHETFNPGERDFRALIARALQAKPDIFVLYTWTPDTETILRQIQELSPGHAATGYFEVVQDLSVLEGKPFVAQYDSAPWFDALFTKHFGRPCRIRAPHAYDLFSLISASLEKLPNDQGASTPALIAELMRIQDYPGAIGSLTVSPTRNITSACVWKEAKAGVLRVVARTELKLIR